MTYLRYNCGTLCNTFCESSPDGRTVHEVDISKFTGLIVVRILSPSRVTVGLDFRLQTSDTVGVQNIAGQIHISFLANSSYKLRINRAKNPEIPLARLCICALIYDSGFFAHVQVIRNGILSKIKEKDANTHRRTSIRFHDIRILGLCGVVTQHDMDLYRRLEAFH